MGSASQVGQWINILPRSQSHTVLGTQEFRENILLRYQARRKSFLEKCDGYTLTNPFTPKHALKCKAVGIVTVRHNEVRESLALVGTQAFSSYSIRD